jgi:hypothetical protein
VLNALQRADEPGGSKEPDLADLGLAPDIVLDPFTGERLRVKKLPEGWLIYSVGSDEQDDGGKTDTFDDYGVAPLPRSPQVTEK